jgi:hypothetical protein
MRKHKNGKQSKTENNNETALDLRNCSDNYSGLEVSKSGLSDSRNEGMCETIKIVKWVRPDWSDKTLLRTDYPEMGVVSYSEGPPEK